MESRRKFRLVLVAVGLSLTLFPVFISAGWAVTGTISANPSPLNLGQTVSISFTFAGGLANAPHTFRITVTKPSGSSSAWIDVPVVSDSTGGGSGSSSYPGSGWTSTSGTVSTDVLGTYNVVLDKTDPNPNENVGSTSFFVTDRLTVTVVSPTAASVSRGDTVLISGSVLDASQQPVTVGTVIATTPRYTIPLWHSSLSPGTWSSQYPVQRDDPLGTWNITIVAYIPGGNSGSDTRFVSVLAAQLRVQNFRTYNSYQTLTSDFSPNDSLYATFEIVYPFGLLTNAFNIQVRDPSGGTVATLQVIYDPNRDLFYTPSGFQFSGSVPSGAWQLFIPALSLTDGYGNTGPATSVTYKFQVNQSQFVVSQFFLIVVGLAAGGSLGAALFLRRFNTTTAPFESFFKLTGGEMLRPASLLIVGDSGAGSTVLGLQLLYRDLSSGKFCGLISYDSFPSEIERRMRDMGWDITSYLEKGQLKILDCYSGIAGIEGALIRDPTDFTEVSIQVTAMIEKSNGPATILFDSATPIFNSAAAKACINFLQVLGVKVKNKGGMFIVTATRSSIPDEARSKIESLTDGVIELGLVKRANSLGRTIQVKKVAGREITSTEAEFVIVADKGILLRKKRVPLSFLHRE